MSDRTDSAANRPSGHRLGRHTPWDDLPEFLTPEEFRDYVGIGRSTVYDLLMRNEIPHVRLGRLYRIPKSVLQQLTSPVK
jgi:excisionase family DNA binding protein